MEIRNSNVNCNTSFGSIYMSPQAKRLLQEKIKSPKQWMKLDNLIKAQKNKPIHITIKSEINDKHKQVLYGHIGSFNLWDKYGIQAPDYYSKPSDSFLFNPLKFIKKLCKIADKKDLSDFNDILKNVETISPTNSL